MRAALKTSSFYSANNCWFKLCTSHSLKSICLQLSNRILHFHFQIVIAGDRDAADTKDLLKCVHSHYMPNKVLMLCDGKEDTFLASKLSIFKTLVRKEGKATAYVCENFTCSLPVNSVEELEKILS